MSTTNVGGGTLPQITGAITGLGGGALLLPKTGGSLVSIMLLAAAAITCGMLSSMVISKFVRRFSR